MSGEIGDLLRQDQYKQAKEVARWYKKIFGDRYYIEIQDHGHPDHPGVWQEQVEVTKASLKLASELDIPCVLTCDAHYLKKEDQEAHEILLCVQTGSFLSDEQRMTLKDFEIYLTDPSDVINRWGKEHPDLIKNTKIISDRCNVEIKLHEIHIPKFEVPKGETEQTHLTKLVYQGLAWRYGGIDEKKAHALSVVEAKKSLPKDIIDRASYELGVINQMNFNGYFLIISDFIGWGKNKGIVFGPGRGSAAGSIISYALKITELDPLKYDLLFERFLNPDRISMPDIDIDIQDSRRDEVIQYCVKKYGEMRVANIVTFGRMAARNAVRDVARVLQVPYVDADRLAKMIPPPVQGRHILLSKSLKNNIELKNEYANNEVAKRVFDLAVQLEGTIRSHGVHAAGVVIAPDEIIKFVPLEMAQKGVVATQYSMGPIEELGLLKIDFLGLSNLTTIKNALRIINRVDGVSIDIDNIPLDDKKTFDLLAKGDTTGVFQLESAGMKRYLKELKPTEFEDIIAMVALYRPGPMQYIEEFIGRKHGRRATEYLHESMEDALQNTYGVIVYQEQVMQISKEMCGFSGGQADTLRKAIGKKKPEELAKLRNDFIEGAIKTVKADRKIMEKFWSQLEDFAAYAFPKSHAACYGLIAYQTAYLKANYPSAFMAALMTSDFNNIDRLNIEISECQHMGIEVLPPDVNESFVEFAVVPAVKNQIRFGMAAIKNVGSSAVEEILAARSLSGTFNSLEDFFGKINPRIVNRKNLESLIKSGALDRFGERAMLLANLDTLIAFSSRIQKQIISGQTDLFGHVSLDSAEKPRLVLNTDVQPAKPSIMLSWERELLGIYLSQHPLDTYKNFLAHYATPILELNKAMENKSVTIGGTIVDVREIMTKNGAKMAFVKLEDLSGQTEIVLFPNDYLKTVSIWSRDQVVLITGKVSLRNDEIKITVDSARVIDEEEAKKAKEIPLSNKDRLYIRLIDPQDQQMLVALKKMIDKHTGSADVVLVLENSDKKQVIKLPTGIDIQSSGINELKELVGAENIKIK
jgi:DNA polymerase-3 subunit alpha